MKTGQITVDLAQEEDIEQILQLNRSEYGPTDILATHADFAWRFDQNPAGQAIIPVLRNENGEAVGFIWVVPLRMRIKGRDHLAATGTNLVIHPEYRNTLGYIKLIRRFEQVFRDQHIPLHFSFVSEKKYQQLRKQNAQTVSTIPLLIRPLNIEALAQARLTQPWQRFIVRGMGNVVMPLIFYQGAVGLDEEIAIQVATQVDDKFDQFWPQVQDKYGVMLIRNQAFLAWRFANLPNRHYHILIAQVGDQMLGYTVLRCASIRGVKTGLIMDLLVTPDGLGETGGAHLLTEAEAYFRREGMSLAAGLMPSFTAEYRLLRQAGYIHLPQILAPRRFRFAFFFHNREKELAALAMHNWFVTLADYESF